MSKYLFTGDRVWDDAAAVSWAFDQFPDITEVVEGECEGLDLLARAEAEQRRLIVHPHPAPWLDLGLEAGPWRNGQMLAHHPDIRGAIAFHDNLAKSTGTKNMVEQLRRRPSVPVWLVSHGPNGLVLKQIQVPRARPRGRDWERR